MKKSIKAIICAASAVVMCAAPTIPALSGTLAPMAITAEAASGELFFEAHPYNNTKMVYAFNVVYSLDYQNHEALPYFLTDITKKYPSFFNYEVVLPSYIEYNNEKFYIKRTGGSFLYNESNIRNVDLSNCKYLESIGGTAFEKTSISEITIPSSVKEIIKGAFRQCNQLKKVTFEGGTSDALTIESDAFSGNNPIEIINDRSNVKFTDSIYFPQGKTPTPFGDNNAKSAGSKKTVITNVTGKYKNAFNKYK